MTCRPRKIATVVGDELANVGEMFADLCPVGELAGGCRDELAAAGMTAKRTRAPLNRAWLAFFTEALSDSYWSTVTATAAPRELAMNEACMLGRRPANV